MPALPKRPVDHSGRPGSGHDWPVGTVSTLKELNQAAFTDPRVRVINDDAFVWIGADNSTYDVAIIDFPDQATTQLASCTPPGSIAC